MELINIADLKDPLDKQGRTYREVNNATNHSLGIGDFVRYTDVDGYRLCGVISSLGRDCDGTPLYSIEVIHHGVSIDDIELIKPLA